MNRLPATVLSIAEIAGNDIMSISIGGALMYHIRMTALLSVFLLTLTCQQVQAQGNLRLENYAYITGAPGFTDDIYQSGYSYGASSGILSSAAEFTDIFNVYKSINMLTHGNAFSSSSGVGSSHFTSSMVANPFAGGGYEIDGLHYIRIKPTTDVVFYAQGSLSWSGTTASSGLNQAAFSDDGMGNYTVLNFTTSSGDQYNKKVSLVMQANTQYEFRLGFTDGSAGALNNVTHQSKSAWSYSLGSAPGSNPNNPLLPVATTTNNDGTTTLKVVVTSSDASTTHFIDPEYALGYSYTSDSILFRSVMIPGALPHGDSSFTLTVGNIDYELLAGAVFDFTQINPTGVASFSITGINPDEMIDPGDPLGFVTGLTFMSEGPILVSMTSIIAVPEVNSLVGVSALATAVSCWCYRRSQLKKRLRHALIS